MEERRPPPAPNTAPAGLEPRGAGGTRSPGAGTGAGSAWAAGAWHLLPLHPRRDILGSGSDGLPWGPSSTPPRDANHSRGATAGPFCSNPALENA